MEDQQPKKQEADVEYLFRSKLPDIYIPDHLPLYTYCFQNISQFKSRPCLIDGPTGRVYTYSEVELTSRRVASGLRKIGLRKGDVIMILLQNSPDFVYAFLAASIIGVVTTTCNPFNMPEEIKKQAVMSKAKLIVTQSCYADKVNQLTEGNDSINVTCVDSPIPEWCFPFSDLIHNHTPIDEEESNLEIGPDDVVALPYSSGTTGLPKGVMLTHRGLVTSVAQQVDGENPNLYFRSVDVILCVLPLFHIYSLNSVLLCGLRVGAAILIMPKFEITSLMRLVDKHKVTIAPFVPPIVLAIAKSSDVDTYDLSSVRVIMSGAAPMGKELEEAVRAKLPNAKFGQGYGMTEAGPVLSMCLSFAKQPFQIKSGSCGTVVRNAQMKILDPETSVSLPANQPGEICIRGKQIMKGYLNDPEATSRTIDEEGWLHTGDIGYIDEDDQLFIVDRLKELIKYKGFQVAPAELEAMLVAHPHISDAAVIPMKDEGAGEVPVAFVVRSNGTLVSEDDIIQFISKQVVFYKRIKRVFFTNSIPKAPSGKIFRKDLRAELAKISLN